LYLTTVDAQCAKPKEGTQLTLGALMEVSPEFSSLKKAVASAAAFWFIS